MPWMVISSHAGSIAVSISCAQEMALSILTRLSRLLGSICVMTGRVCWLGTQFPVFESTLWRVQPPLVSHIIHPITFHNQLLPFTFNLTTTQLSLAFQFPAQLPMATIRAFQYIIGTYNSISMSLRCSFHVSCQMPVGTPPSGKIRNILTQYMRCTVGINTHKLEVEMTIIGVKESTETWDTEMYLLQVRILIKRWMSGQ